MQTTTMSRMATGLGAIPFSAQFLEAFMLLLYHGNLNYGLLAGAQPCPRQTAAPLPQARTPPTLPALSRSPTHQEALLQRSHRRQAAVGQEDASGEHSSLQQQQALHLGVRRSGSRTSEEEVGTALTQSQVH